MKPIIKYPVEIYGVNYKMKIIEEACDGDYIVRFYRGKYGVVPVESFYICLIDDDLSQAVNDAIRRFVEKMKKKNNLDAEIKKVLDEEIVIK